MSPMQIWNEAQERYVVAIAPESLPVFGGICERERCPFAVVGHATDDGRLVVADAHFGGTPRRHAAIGSAREASAHAAHG